MKPFMQWKRSLLVFLAVTLLLAALPSTALAAQSDLVRFTVENRADRNITIRLYSMDGSGRAYYMQVLADTTKIMTPPRGTYGYRLTACGVMVYGEVDLNGPLTWIMPDCGDKGGPGSKAPNTQDIGKILALSKLTLVNDPSNMCLTSRREAAARSASSRDSTGGRTLPAAGNCAKGLCMRSVRSLRSSFAVVSA